MRFIPCFIRQTAAIAVVGILAWSSTASADVIPILEDGNSTVDLDGYGTLIDNWTIDANSILYEQGLFYRIGSTGEEFGLNSLEMLDFSLTGTNTFSALWQLEDVFQLSVSGELTGGAPGSGTSQLVTNIAISNISGSLLDFFLFAYSDLDIFDIEGDTATWISSSRIDQSDTSGAVIETSFSTPFDAFELAQYSDQLDSLTDSSTTTLSNSPTSIGPFDSTFTVMWNPQIAVDDSFELSITQIANNIPEGESEYAVPEPGSIVLLGLGGLVLLAARRRKRAI
ncbi:MAG: PEP-CTERM sorting domain-containing protein [Planctomycetota bacterium]|nr:PEP-CTERM sorting domain-containing protein [Planctomycetota bacterium]